MKKKRLCFRLPRGMREKIEKVMKLFWILMCVFTFSVSAESLAQQERVSLNLKDVAVRALFDEIQRQTNLYFVFNGKAGTVVREREGRDGGKRVATDSERNGIDLQVPGRSDRDSTGG